MFVQNMKAKEKKQYIEIYNIRGIVYMFMYRKLNDKPKNHYIDYRVPRDNCMNRMFGGEEKYLFVLSLKTTGVFPTACKLYAKNRTYI